MGELGAHRLVSLIVLFSLSTVIESRWPSSSRSTEEIVRPILFLIRVSIPAFLPRAAEPNISQTHNFFMRLNSGSVKWVSCSMATSAFSLFRCLKIIPRLCGDLRPFTFHDINLIICCVFGMVSKRIWTYSVMVLNPSFRTMCVEL